MKPWLKALLWALIGGGVGFFAGERVGEKIANERMENNPPQMSQEELERLEKMFNRAASCSVPLDNFNSRMEEYRGHRMTDAESTRMVLDEIDSHFGTMEEINQFLNQKGIQPATDEDPMPEVPEMPAFSGNSEQSFPNQADIPHARYSEDHVVPQLHPTQILPEIVTEEEYYRNEWEFEEERLVYYEGDEVLFNTATQTTIDYPENVLGVGTLSEFRAGPGEPKETIFVVNEIFGTRFRVDRVTEAFCDEVGETTGPEDDLPDEADENPHPSDEYWDDV